MFRFLFIVILTNLSFGSCHAQEPSPAIPQDESLRALVQFAEPSTLAMVRLNTSRIDAAAVADYFIKQSGDVRNEANLRRVAMMADGFLTSMRQAGAKDLVVTLSADELLKMTPAIMTRVDDPNMVKGLLSMAWSPLSERSPLTMRSVGDVTCFGANSTLDRISDPANRDQRFANLFAGRSLDHQLMISWPKENREDLMQLWPDALPEASPVQFSPRQLLKDVDAIRVAWSLPPEPAFSMTLFVVDQAAAQRVGALVREITRQADDRLPRMTVSVDAASVQVDASAKVVGDFMAANFQSLRAAARRQQRANDFKQMGVAMHNHFAAKKKLPDTIVDENGNALLSHRVAMLPYLDQTAIFDAIKRDEAWDSQANQEYAETVIRVFGDTDRTNIRIPVIKGSLYADSETPKTFRSIRDGTSNTIAMAEAPSAAATPWMKPGFWELDEDNLIDSFFGDRESAMVLMFDGSVQTLSRTIDPKMLRALLTHDGREVIDREN
ncbi:MAG: DUF1559 domain-containing protein [Planctomycetota bacterium]